MFIVNNYLLAVVLCFVTMLCWGSWGNTQKMAAKSWRYELFYWDYVIGMVLFALLIAFTMGSFGTEGRPFLEDIAQVSAKNVGSIILGGIIFNASNILLSASTSIAGMAVAVTNKKETLFADGFGVESIERPEVRVTKTSLFRIASITKIVTGMTLLSLVEEGKLSLDAPVKVKVLVPLVKFWV